MPSFFLARQPILDVEGQTYGYELLFRSGETNAYDPSVDGDTATSRVLIDTITELGIEKIVDNRLAFVNLTDRFLAEPALLDLLPVGRVVLEVLETVAVNENVVAGVKALKDLGHVIALDDFVGAEQFAPLLPLADIIKYDITDHDMDALGKLCVADHQAGRRVLAERVETREEFDTLVKLGFDYFQGYFFAKPNIVSGARLPSNRLTLLQLIGQINDPAVSIDELAEIMSREVSLGVRALKYVNSPMSGLAVEVSSIRQAIMLLGRDLIRNWVTLLVMSGADDKPQELASMALVRARFCQLAANRAGLPDDSSLFTMGLLSMLDVMMDAPMQTVLDSIRANDGLRAVLLDGHGPGGLLLKHVRALERPFEAAMPLEPPCGGDPDLMRLHELLVEHQSELFQLSILWAQESAGLL